MRVGDVDLGNPDSFANGFPHAYFKLLRAEAPVAFNPEPDGPGFWVISKYEDVKAISRNPTVFSSWQGGTNIDDLPPEDLAGTRAIMLNMDPPQHVKYRRLVQRGFTPRMIQKQEVHIRDLARRIVDRVAVKGECEFVSEVAAELPMQVICEMVGVPEEDRRTIYDLSNRLIGFDDPEFQTSLDIGKQAATQMFLYASKLAERARRCPADDLATALATGDVDGETLSDLDYNSFFLLLAVAGNETTRTVTSHGMRLLIEHPEQRARLVKDPSLIPSAIEEIVRYNPPVMYFRRTAMRDTQIRGIDIRAGDKLTLWYPSANRDEDVFVDPERFDVGRTPNEHLAFGIGEHFCLGASLARLELVVIFEELLRRLPDMQLAAPIRRLRSNFIDGVKEMRVRFTAHDSESEAAAGFAE
jgi:cholest-4-en-3-one 26-monooxygenase